MFLIFFVTEQMSSHYSKLFPLWTLFRRSTTLWWSLESFYWNASRAAPQRWWQRWDLAKIIQETFGCARLSLFLLSDKTVIAIKLISARIVNVSLYKFTGMPLEQLHSDGGSGGIWRKSSKKPLDVQG